MLNHHLNSNEKCLTRNRVRHLFFGADEANRTPDLLITNQLLYQLSYISVAAYFTNKSNAAVSAKTVFCLECVATMIEMRRLFGEQCQVSVLAD
jgi:hypothetical protein